MKIRSVFMLKLYAVVVAMALYAAMALGLLATIDEPSSLTVLGVVLVSWFVCDKWLIPVVVRYVVLDIFEPPSKGDDHE